MSINDYSELPEEFKERIEEAKQIAQEGKSGCKRNAACHILFLMNRRGENNLFLFPHIPYRKLTEWTGISRATFNAARKSIEGGSETDENSVRSCVYILTNPSMPGLIKIGKTTVAAQQRADELYQTGVPTPFSVEYSIPTNDPDSLECHLHKVFKNHRVNKDREFFSCSADEVLEQLKNKKFQEALKLLGVFYKCPT